MEEQREKETTDRRGKEAKGAKRRVLSMCQRKVEEVGEKEERPEGRQRVKKGGRSLES